MMFGWSRFASALTFVACLGVLVVPGPGRAQGRLDTRTGTLRIEFGPRVRNVIHPYWIYVNGKIVATRPMGSGPFNTMNPYQLRLNPGRYTVEIAVATRGVPDVVFPFTFSNRDPANPRHVTGDDQAEVRSGEVTTFVVERLYEWFSANARAAIPDDEPIGPVRERESSNVTSCTQSDVYRELSAALTALSVNPPVDPVVRLDLAREHGGNREFDATEVRLLVYWLAQQCYPDNALVERVAQSRASAGTRDADAWSELASSLNRGKRAIETLGAIADKLQRLPP